jgi:hypothetical protein
MLFSPGAQAKEPKESDEEQQFERMGKFSAGGDEPATDGDRRRLMQKTDPKEPKEVRMGYWVLGFSGVKVGVGPQSTDGSSALLPAQCAV